MGKQYNKVQKRARLKRYIERQKAKARAAMKPSKKKYTPVSRADLSRR